MKFILFLYIDHHIDQLVKWFFQPFSEGNELWYIV
jgi:hypothetical protein